MDYVDTILTSSDANNYFGTSQCCCGSKTLEATLRYIAIKNNGGDIAKTRLINVDARQADYNVRSGNAYTEERYDGYELLIITPRNRGDDLLSINVSGWVSLDSPPYPVAALLSAKSSETRIYVNGEKKRSIVFVRTTTENWCDLFASCLFRVLPWLFNNEEEAAAIARAITKNQTEEFKAIINACCADFDFRGFMIRRNLIGWASSFRASQIESLERQMADYANRVRNLEAEIDDYLNKYGAANDNLLALKRSSDGDDDTLLQFFLNHHQLDVYKISNYDGGGKSLQYSIIDTIEYYDEDNFLNNYNNRNSTIGGSNPDMKRILYGIFKEHKGVIRVEAIFKLTNLSSLTPVKYERTGKFNATHLPHPHLYHAGCLGGNKQYIDRYMMAGDWDMAIEQSIAAVKNVNMGDAAIIGAMVRDIAEAMDTCSCIVADNGQAMTPRQFLEYLRRGDNNEGTTNG